MKKFVVILTAVMLLLVCSSCGKKGDLKFSDENEAYDSMVRNAENGNYEDALRCYEAGASSADKGDVLDWYYFSMAGRDNVKEGCLGYSLDLLQNRIGTDFQPSKALLGKLQNEVRNFNGAYSGPEYFMYFSDGKIAVSDMGMHLTGDVVCDGELVLLDNVYYWAKHNVNGEDTILYKITPKDYGFDLETATDKGSENTMYAGAYRFTEAEMPNMMY